MENFCGFEGETVTKIFYTRHQSIPEKIYAYIEKKSRKTNEQMDKTPDVQPDKKQTHYCN